MNQSDTSSFETFAQLARDGKLQADFDHWALADHKGWTVAHEAVWFGHLPPGFNHWALTDADGWTLAHLAAAWGHLSPDFNQWGLTKADGETVVDVARRVGNAKSMAQYEAWRLRQAVDHVEPVAPRLSRSRV